MKSHFIRAKEGSARRRLRSEAEGDGNGDGDGRDATAVGGAMVAWWELRVRWDLGCGEWRGGMYWRGVLSRRVWLMEE